MLTIGDIVMVDFLVEIYKYNTDVGIKLSISSVYKTEEEKVGGGGGKSSQPSPNKRMRKE